MQNGTFVLINATTINPGESLFSNPIFPLGDIVKFSLTIEGRYNMSKTWESNGLRVKVLTAPETTGIFPWDITPYAEFDAPSNSSKYVRATASIIPDVYSVRCQVINLNTNETAYDCRLIATYSETS